MADQRAKMVELGLDQQLRLAQNRVGTEAIAGIEHGAGRGDEHSGAHELTDGAVAKLARIFGEGSVLPARVVVASVAVVWAAVD